MLGGQHRRVDPPRAVLIAAGGGWFMGRLMGWERLGGVWHGHVDRATGVSFAGAYEIVPADRLRPFDPRPLDVKINGEWTPGTLIGCRRPPGRGWEGLVKVWTGPGSGPSQWHPIDRLRRPSSGHRE